MMRFLKVSSYTLVASIILIAGAYLRLSFPEIIEYKTDEELTQRFVVDYRSKGSIPTIGQDSSNGLRHPPLAAWIYISTAEVFKIETPVGLSRICQIGGILAIVVLLFAGFKFSDPQARFLWLSAVGFYAFSPFHVIQDRKMWHASLVSLVGALMIYAGLRRNRFWTGAFLFGLFSALIGQIYLVAYFFAVGLLIGAWVHLRFLAMHINGWLLGSVFGAIPLYPWIQWIFAGSSDEPLKFNFTRLITFRFWNMWFSNLFGYSTKSTLGHEWFRWVSVQHIGEVPLGPKNLFMFSLMLLILIASVLFLRKRRKSNLNSVDPSLKGIAISGVFYSGLVATVSGLFIPRYLLHSAGVMVGVSFVVLIASVFNQRLTRLILGLVMIGQFFLSYSLIHFLDDFKSSVRGDFGTPYKYIGTKFRRSDNDMNKVYY